ncbi:MAG: O-antigen ligase family protein [Pseudomonadota bacterium]
MTTDPGFAPRTGRSNARQAATDVIAAGEASSGLAARIRNTLPWILLLGYAGFSCGYFLFGDYSDHYRFYSRGLFFLSLFVIATPLRQLLSDSLFRLILAYMSYFLISALWSSPFDVFRLGQKFVLCALIISFLAVTHYLYQWRTEAFLHMLRLCIGIAAVAGLTSIAVFYQSHEFPSMRLEGLGSLTNINEFSNVYAVFALLAAGFATNAKSFIQRVPYLVAIGVFLSVAWFGQSRTSFVALSACLIAYAALTLPGRRMLIMVYMLAFVVALVLAFPGSLQEAVTRGAGLRPAIWLGMWDHAQDSILFGNGLITELHVIVADFRMETAHNAYLQAVLHGGLLGLALLVALLCYGLMRAWQLGQSSGNYVVLCILMYCSLAMLTGVDTLIERPRDQWMLFWFPFALLLSQPRANTL